MSPGFAGIDNPLYDLDKTLMLFGDARSLVGGGAFVAYAKRHWLNQLSSTYQEVHCAWMTAYPEVVAQTAACPSERFMHHYARVTP